MPISGEEQKVAGLAFVLIDGVGDVGIAELGGRTPLQHAEVPFLDAVSSMHAPASLSRSCSSSTCLNTEHCPVLVQVQGSTAC